MRVPGAIALCLAVVTLSCEAKPSAGAHETTAVVTSEAAAARDRTTPQCGAVSGASIQVSSDSIGGLPLSESLARLKALCAIATPTAFQGGESTSPGLSFPFDSLKVVAFQHSDELDTLRAADAWEVEGCGGRFRKGVSTCATWAELVAAYGDSGEGSTEFGPARVRLRTMPGYAFELDVTEGTVGSLEVQPDLSRIPATARLVRTILAPAAP